MVPIFYMLLLKTVSSVETSNRIRMSRYPELDGKNITSSGIWTSPELELVSMDNCADRCAALAECASFFHNSVTGQCQLQKHLFMTDDGASMQDNLRYYYKIKGRNDWCPVDDGYQLLAVDGPCVKFHTDTRTWSRAEEMCGSYSPYSRLVVMDTQEKNALVKAAGIAINDQFTTGVYIGLTKLDPIGWRWVDGTNVTFADWTTLVHWAPEECVALLRANSWTWRRLPCTYFYHYICEIVVDRSLYNTMMNIVN